MRSSRLRKLYDELTRQFLAFTVAIVHVALLQQNSALFRKILTIIVFVFRCARSNSILPRYPSQSGNCASRLHTHQFTLRILPSLLLSFHRTALSAWKNNPKPFLCPARGLPFSFSHPQNWRFSTVNHSSVSDFRVALLPQTRGSFPFARHIPANLRLPFQPHIQTETPPHRRLVFLSQKFACIP